MDNVHRVNVLVLEPNLSHKQELFQIDKLHKRFGQGSVNSTEKLKKNPNPLPDKISALIKEAVNHCTKWIKFEKPSLCPMVAISINNGHNIVSGRILNFEFSIGNDKNIKKIFEN